MNVLDVARKAVFGETWSLPLAVAGLIGTALATRALLPELWQGAGGPLLLGGAAAILFLLTRPKH